MTGSGALDCAASGIAGIIGGIMSPGYGGASGGGTASTPIGGTTVNNYYRFDVRSIDPRGAVSEIRAILDART